MSPFTSLYRSLTRHKLFAALNIGGLALGIATFLVLFLFVRFETGYDKRLAGWDRLWLVEDQYTRPGFPSPPNEATMGDELDQLRGDFPGLVGTRFKESNAIIRQGSAASAERLAIVDANFFALFPFPTAAGNASATLARPGGLVLTETAARKYLGEQSPIGRMLALTIDGATYTYRIGAVLRDMPDDVTFKAEMFVPLVHDRFANHSWREWGSSSVVTLLRFPDAAAARSFAQQQLPRFLERHAYPGGNVKRETFHQLLLPLADYHLLTPGDFAIVATLGVVGLLTLLIAIMNYVNLATARAGLRAREVAMRKVLGATRVTLMRQFLGEAIGTVAVAALIGLALAELALPFVNAAGGTKLAIRYWGGEGVLLPLALVVILVGGIAGAYPAAVLSGFRPAAVLASARTPGGGRAGTRLRSALVVAQFAIAIAFAISTAVMLAQTAHIAAADIGFHREGLIVVRSFADATLDKAQKAQVIAAFRAAPGVTAIGYGVNAPGDQFSTSSSGMSRPETPDRNPSVRMVDTGPGYFATVGTRLIAGRLFDPAFGEDDSAGQDRTADTGRTTNLVMNETAIRQLGFASPAAAIGASVKGIESNRIVGVIADQRFQSPREEVAPTAYLYTSAPIDYSFALVRYAGADAAAVTDRLEAIWKRIVPGVPFQARTADQNLYERYYKADAQRERLFTIGAVLAVLIGCIGLYGLAAFDTARRVKEIGIRKTLGASTRDVLTLLLGKFMRPVLVASILAWPIAYVAMRRWLGGFDDRIALSPLFFIAATLAAMAIATATIFAQSWRVARAEPARALRYE